jgi:hypothetical protein
VREGRIPATQLLLVGTIAATLFTLLQWIVYVTTRDFYILKHPDKGLLLYFEWLYKSTVTSLVLFLPFCLPVALFACALYIVALKFGMKDRLVFAIIVGFVCQVPYFLLLNEFVLDNHMKIRWNVSIESNSALVLLVMTANSAAFTWWWTRSMHPDVQVDPLQ